MDTSEDIYAIGDAHGDYERFTGLLVRAGLIKESPKDPIQVEWTGGNSVLVCTGDLIDKAPANQKGGSLKLLRVMKRLQELAPKGHVVLTLGNHEALFLADPGAKKVQDLAGDVAAAHLSIESIVRGENCAPPGDAAESCRLGEFLRGLPFGARVNRWFFSHGGNTGGRSIPELERFLAKGLDDAGFAPVVEDPRSILQARLCSAKQAEEWEADDQPGSCSWWGDDPLKTLERAATALQVDHLVQGHQSRAVAFPADRQRTDGAIFQKHGLVFLIDGGMSRNPNVSKSGGGILRIFRENGTEKAVVLCARKKKPVRIWSADEKEPVAAEALCR